MTTSTEERSFPIERQMMPVVEMSGAYKEMLFGQLLVIYSKRLDALILTQEITSK